MYVWYMYSTCRESRLACDDGGRTAPVPRQAVPELASRLYLESWHPDTQEAELRATTPILPYS